MKKVLILLIIASCLSGCLSSQKKANRDFDKEMKGTIERTVYALPDSILSFFPDNSKGLGESGPTLYRTYASIRKELAYQAMRFRGSKLVELYAFENYNKRAEMIDSFRQAALSNVRSESDDYFILAGQTDLMNRFGEETLREKYLEYQDRPLIPDFRTAFEDVADLSVGGTLSGLPEGFEIITLKSGDDFVLTNPNYYYDWDVLPDKIKHGYRAGVAFSEDKFYLIYWITAW